MSRKVDWLSVLLVVTLLTILVVGVRHYPKSQATLDEMAGLYNPPLTGEQAFARDKANAEFSVQSDAQLRADRAAAEKWHKENLRRTPPLGATADTTGP